MESLFLQRFYLLAVNLLLLYSLFFCIPDSLWAREVGLKGANPSFFLDITFGFSTYKSKMVDSNDTSTGLTYKLGGCSGNKRQFCLFHITDTTTTSFELNTSKIVSQWQDTNLRYYWNYIYIGPVFTDLNLQVTQSGTEFIDGAGTGVGGNLGFIFPMSKVGVFYIDVVSTSIAKMKNSLTQEVTAVARQDIDIGAQIDITSELLDFILGYKQRTIATSAGTSYADSYLITYFGLRIASFF